MVHVGSPGPARPSGGSTTLLTPNWPPTQEPGRMRGCCPLMKARRPLCRVTALTPPDPDLPPGRSSHTCICHQGCHGTSLHPRHLPRGSWGCGPRPSLLPLTGLLLLRAASSARRRLWATSAPYTYRAPQRAPGLTGALVVRTRSGHVWGSICICVCGHRGCTCSLHTLMCNPSTAPGERLRQNPRHGAGGSQLRGWGQEGDGRGQTGLAQSRALNLAGWGEVGGAVSRWPRDRAWVEESPPQLVLSVRQ